MSKVVIDLKWTNLVENTIYTSKELLDTSPHTPFCLCANRTRSKNVPGHGIKLSTNNENAYIKVYFKLIVLS